MAIVSVLLFETRNEIVETNGLGQLMQTIVLRPLELYPENIVQT